jgi:hypothetical protein
MVLLVLLAGSGTASAQANEEQGRLQKAMLQEARKVYEQNVAVIKAGREGVGPEEMYRWSQRWLDSQLDLAATKEERRAARRDHFERMKGLEKIAQALVQAGKEPPAHASAATYYRLQAELWLSREQAN